jgi:lysine 2,3-aminomutase
VTLLNQSVLLAGVNDSAETLELLFQRLYESGVIPFYLHHPDWTPGTFQFRSSIERGRELVAELRGRLPGPALPEYVLDLPQGLGKASLSDARRLSEHGDSELGGAVYEVPRPATRDPKAPERSLYLDLFYRRPRRVC